MIVSAIICFGYAAFMKWRYDITSISQSYYKTGEKIYFWLWAVLTAFTLLPFWLEATNESYQFLAFLSASALMAVGCCPDYKDEHSVYHPLFTAICGLIAVVWCMFNGTWYYFIPVLLAAIFLKREDKLFWIEILSFLAIYLSLLFHD